MAATQINTTSGNGSISYNRGIFRTSGGTLYAVTGGNGKLHVYKGPSSGWPAAGQDAAHEPTGPLGFTACMDSNDVIWIFYYTSVTNISLISFATATDTYGTAASMLTTTTTSSYYLACCCDGNDYLHLAYLDNYAASADRLRYVNNTSGSWSSPIDINPTSNKYTQYIGMEAASDGVIIAFDEYQGAGKGNLDAVHITSVDWTVDGTKVLSLNNENYGQLGWASVAVDTNGDVYILYGKTGSSATLTLYKKAAATAWTGTWSSDTLDNNAYYGTGTIALHDGKVYIVAIDNTNQNVVKITNASGSWVVSTLDACSTTTAKPTIRWSYYNNPSYGTYPFDLYFAITNYAEYESFNPTVASIGGIMF